MRPPRFILLNAEQKRTLEEAYQRGPKYQFRIRCLCILLSSQGRSITMLKDYFEVSRQTIYSWMNAWEQQGLAGLYTQPGQGRKPLYTKIN